MAPDSAIQGLAQNRYWDRHFELQAVKLLPGEYYAGRDVPLMVTVLGSCVSACIRDPERGVGGMNHFMLANASGDQSSDTAGRYGVYAMELLINRLIRLGGRRDHLEVKLFGGGNLMRSKNDGNVGSTNARFALDYFKREGLKVVSQDLFGHEPRKIWYFPDRGKVLLKRLKVMRNQTIVERERAYARRLQQAPKSGDVELFD